MKNVIVLYGAVAVGKLTVGKELSRTLGYKLTHNHLVSDLVWSIFERGTLEANSLIEKLRYEIHEAAVKSGQGLVTTHCYGHNYVSPTGLSDPEYLKTLEQRLEKMGARVLFVHLQADKETLLNRVINESRKEYKKLTKVPKMRDLLDKEDFTTSAPVKKNLVIDNSKLSPEEVVHIITEHYKLKSAEQEKIC
ncbi:MAG: AAA family ATPase [bacterium]|nr:AAA family ATPase [bacterium]